MDPWLISIPTILLGVVLPGTLVVIRETVKRHRQEVVRDLAAVFDVPDAIIPSFEFVKFKYFLQGVDREVADRHRGDFPPWAWIGAMIPFGAVTMSVAWIGFDVLTGGSNSGVVAAANGMPPLWATAACAAFLGAYLIAIRGLYRAINNFDLSPALFIDSAINILAGVALAVLVVSAVAEFWPATSITTAAVILFAFAVGFFPEAAQREIVSRSRLRNYKRERASIYTLFQATPIELIDGIDTEIRDRLSDYHIASTQNLAAANPLMLFVETPFGVYQIMDWVAQAQLCASVGPDSMAALWKVGVRTLFDLERAALNDNCRNSKLLNAIGDALFPTANEPAARTEKWFDEDAIIASIEMRLDDPHVHRLRQIYMRVGETIGPESWRFPKDRPTSGFNKAKPSGPRSELSLVEPGGTD